jgi:hypothetical protein
MLSAVISVSGKDAAPARADPAVALARSLTALVPAMIEGLLADVTIAGPQGYELAAVADYAGCGFVEALGERDWLSAAFTRAKGASLLVMRAGFFPGVGFIEELRDCLAGGDPRGVFRAAPERWPERLLPNLAPPAAAMAATDIWRACPAQDFHRAVRALKLPARRTPMHRVT